jgi:GNAT superfamily N-acetyltransferase
MLITLLTGDHDRGGFACGRRELDDWLRRIARQHQDKGLSRTFVAVDEREPRRILAYYALSTAEVDTSGLPEVRRRKFPRGIPAVRLGRLAVDQRCQGRRLGELMLVDAIERVRVIAQHAGVVALIVDAIDENAARFYARYGFEHFLDEPLRLFMPLRS